MALARVLFGGKGRLLLGTTFDVSDSARRPADMGTHNRDSTDAAADVKSALSTGPGQDSLPVSGDDGA